MAKVVALPLVKPVNTAIGCGRCYLGQTRKCCTNLHHYIFNLTREEAEVFGLEHVEEQPTVTGADSHLLYRAKFPMTEHAECPHYTADGMCGIPEKRPLICVAYPVYISPESIQFDMACPGVSEFVVNLNTEENLKHIQYAMEMYERDPEACARIFAMGKHMVEAKVSTADVVELMKRRGMKYPAMFEPEINPHSKRGMGM